MTLKERWDHQSKAQKVAFHFVYPRNLHWQDSIATHSVPGRIYLALALMRLCHRLLLVRQPQVHESAREGRDAMRLESKREIALAVRLAATRRFATEPNPGSPQQSWRHYRLPGPLLDGLRCPVLHVAAAHALNVAQRRHSMQLKAVNDARIQHHRLPNLLGVESLGK